jgi:hypothetical protein
MIVAVFVTVSVPESATVVAVVVFVAVRVFVTVPVEVLDAVDVSVTMTVLEFDPPEPELPVFPPVPELPVLPPVPPAFPPVLCPVLPPVPWVGVPPEDVTLVLASGFVFEPDPPQALSNARENRMCFQTRPCLTVVFTPTVRGKMEFSGEWYSQGQCFRPHMWETWKRKITNVQHPFIRHFADAIR